MSIAKYIDRQTVAKALVLIVLWGVCIYFVVKLSREYQDSGQKNTVSQDILRVTSMEVPYFIVATSAGECKWNMLGCSFFRNSTLTSCSEAVTYRDLTGEVSFLNATRARELGVLFTTPFDIILWNFKLVFVSNGTPATPGACRLLTHDLFVIPVGDQATIADIVNGGNNLDLNRVGIPSYIGYGQHAHFTFSLEQEIFIGSNKPQNTTTFGLTQFPVFPKKDAFQLRISAASFYVRRIVHKEGQSLIDLMGGIFGWVGILTGACIQSLFSTLVDVAAKAKKEQEKQMKKKKRMDSLGENDFDSLKQSMLPVDLTGDKAAVQGERIEVAVFNL